MSASAALIQSPLSVKMPLRLSNADFALSMNGEQIVEPALQRR